MILFIEKYNYTYMSNNSNMADNNFNYCWPIEILKVASTFKEIIFFENERWIWGCIIRVAELFAIDKCFNGRCK